MSTKRSRSGSLLRQPIEPVLNLSRMRLLLLGGYFIILNATSYLTWTIHSPQPYESLVLRAISIIGAIPLLFLRVSDVQSKGWVSKYLIGYFAYAGPGFCLWLFLQNGGGSVWMTYICLMAMVMYQITDWRTATGSIAISLFATTALAHMGNSELAQSATLLHVLSGHNLGVDHHLGIQDAWLAFFLSWATAILMGISSASQRMQRLDSQLRAMGIMAHELRTPLASASLLTDGLSETSSPSDIQMIRGRLSMVINAMNHQIDSQIVNAQLLHLKPGDEQIGARALAQNAVDSYPFQSTKERVAVRLEAESDFVFSGNPRLFTQVIHNLLKNAIYAMKSDKSKFDAGDLRIRICRSSRAGFGRIEIHDRGPGIPQKLRRTLFDPFVSGSSSHSSGLGLSFCQNIVEIHGGRITHESSKNGTSFFIDLPVDNREIAVAFRKPSSTS